MIKNLISGFVLVLFSTVFVLAQNDMKKVTTVKEVCAAYPEKMDFIFQNLDLNYKGLEKVKKAYEKKDLLGSCSELLTYYKQSKSKGFFNYKPVGNNNRNSTADSILLDIFKFQGVAGKVPRKENGCLDWFHTGPENDIEWAWALNRHYPAAELLNIWQTTGNPEYARYIDSFIKDWIVNSWPYPAKKSGTAMWRGLEVSFRVKLWAQVFFGMEQSSLISPATRLLILSSIPDHAHYARNFHGQNNWLTMEISGLASVGAYWPEFRESSAWLRYCIGTMTESMKEQVYADGVQTELTSSYHHVALNNFNLFLSICKNAAITLPEYYTQTLEKMWEFLAFTMRPDGYGILNNDADLVKNRENIIKAAKNYNRSDWQYIASNGEYGLMPKEGPSFLFPWAGQLISRSGYDKNAQWSFFDIGPWGSGHQHNDKLNLAIAAFGRDLLVDGGRFAYRGAIADKFRKYATGSQSHNVILIDGNGQAPGPLLADKPLSESSCKITPEFDFGTGTHDKFLKAEGICSHTRSVFYNRGKYWIVVDHIATDRIRKIETLWHWHPLCTIAAREKGVVTSVNEKGNLMIVPVGKTDWKINLIKGQEKPDIQGWYSPEYNSFEPNVTAVYSDVISADKTFVWLLIPFETKSPEVVAEIISGDKTGIRVKINSPDMPVHVVSIPFSESKNAGIE